MKYLVKFEFTCVDNRSKTLALTGKSGEIEVDSTASAEQLKEHEDLIPLISREMEKKTKRQVFSVDIGDITKIN